MFHISHTNENYVFMIHSHVEREEKERKIFERIYNPCWIYWFKGSYNALFVK